MKSIKYFLGVSIIGLVLTACDALDKEPYDAFTDDNFWTQSPNVEAFANAFYNDFVGYGSGTNGWFYFTKLNDDQVGENFIDWSHITLSTTNSLWKNSYEEIKRANKMLQKVPDIEGMDEIDKRHWIGVAKMMRAYEYFILVKNFGDVQWVTKPLGTDDNDILYGKRTDPGRDIVMDSVLSDLDTAIVYIKTKKDNCAWSKALALAMKSDVCLYEGTFCKYRVKGEGSTKDSNPDRAKTYLEECVKANDVLMGMGYDLEPGVEGYAATYNSLDLTTSNQIIFAKHYVKDVLSHSLINWTVSSTTSAGISKPGFEAFKLIATGKKGTYSDADYPIKAVQGTTNEGKDWYLSLVDVLALRDKRLSALIDEYLGILSQAHVRWDTDLDGHSDLDVDHGNEQGTSSSSGYTIMKYDSKEITYDYRNTASKNYTDCPLYWYAVILLNQAEAKAELGTITDADLDATVNKLRERGGLPALTIGNYYDESSLIEAIHNDRRCELMCDNNYRYWDLIRWHQLDRLVDDEVYWGANMSKDHYFGGPERTAMHTTADGFITPTYYPDKKRKTDGGGVKGVGKYYLFPIPADERKLNPNLGQNPGW